MFRALTGVGDLLCLVPALRALRRRDEGALVVLVGSPSARWFADRFPGYVDELVELPAWPGIDGTGDRMRDVPRFLAEMQARELDLALQCHGGGPHSNALVALLGARAHAGYFLPGQWCPHEERYLPWDGYEPEPLRWLRLLAHIGIPDAGFELELPVHDDDRDALTFAWPAWRSTPYAVVAPGATHPSRRWSAAGFAGVVDGLVARGLDVVVAGTDADRPVTRDVLGRATRASIDLTGQLTIGSLAALVDGARAVVTNDSGTSHVAAARHTPSVVVFRASDPRRWAPLDRDRHRVLGENEPIVAEHLARRGRGRCLAEGCAVLPHDVMPVPAPAVTATAVLAEVDDLLAGARRQNTPR